VLLSCVRPSDRPSVCYKPHVVLSFISKKQMELDFKFVTSIDRSKSWLAYDKLPLNGMNYVSGDPFQFLLAAVIVYLWNGQS